MPRRIEISREELERLYWGEKMSMNQIVKIKNLGYHEKVRRMMIAYKIPRRIRKESQKLCNVAKPFPKSFTKSHESIGFLLGIHHGDGHITKNMLQLQFKIKDMDFMKTFIIHSKKIGFKPSKVIRRKNKNSFLWTTAIYSKRLCQYLKTLKITSLNKKQKINYVNAIFDSDGCVHKKPTITIESTDKKLLLSVQRLLNSEFKIKSKIYSNPLKARKIFGKTYRIHRMYHSLFITKKDNLMKFHHHFHFSIKRKQDRLVAIVESYKK